MIVSLPALACGLTRGPAVEPSPESIVEPTTPVAEATTPPQPEPEDTAVRAVDGMEVVLIPAGEFLMGDDASAFAPEKPAHIV
jgi:formylglycine-generating enzyme required for sulfatase activity